MIYHQASGVTLHQGDALAVLAGLPEQSVQCIVTSPPYSAFPTEIPRRALKAGSRPGDLVLDPFVGSGTTAVVARELGRECVGIDQKAEYLDIAIHRLARTATPLPLPLPLPPPLRVPLPLPLEVG